MSFNCTTKLPFSKNLLTILSCCEYKPALSSALSVWFSPAHLNLFFLEISPCLCGFPPLFSRWLAFLLVLSANALGTHSCMQFYHKQFFYIVEFEEEDMLEICFKICYLSLMRCILCGLFICAYW